MSYLVILTVLLILLIAVSILNRGSHAGGGGFYTGGAGGSGSKLALNLKNKGWRIHTSGGCGWCEKQKADIPGALEVGLAHECNGQCAVSGYPSWENIRTGEKLPGYQSPEAVARL